MIIAGDHTSTSPTLVHTWQPQGLIVERWCPSSLLRSSSASIMKCFTQLLFTATMVGVVLCSSPLASALG